MMKQIVGFPLKYNVSCIRGKPDIVVQKLKLAVFVDGCFWHGCVEHGRIPKSHQSYWRSKIVGNMVRDEENTVLLEEEGWSVWRVWEHDLRPEALQKTRRKLKRKMLKLLPAEAFSTLILPLRA
jgi:DNA mismatch endonuclease (patch repair protein)